MTLDNLLKTGQLKRHATGRREIGDLLAAARRNLADARAENISVDFIDLLRVDNLCVYFSGDPVRLLAVDVADVDLCTFFPEVAAHILRNMTRTLDGHLLSRK